MRSLWIHIIYIYGIVDLSSRSQVAGTEMGITEPTATFSACFGAPFMVWHPAKYAELLAEKMAKHNVNAQHLATYSAYRDVAFVACIAHIYMSYIYII